ncbi:unnamed protein product [Paramecium sonneborni]|uniref:Uncharacterized protein n=1 Tax=Paramecium sonneborni TaxID=65129 RepID=A0A8S1PF13_9CILI|nr:unnamed protein product [Paramecium sonneborni]
MESFIDLNKTIKLIQNNECEDDIYFQMIQNKDKKILLLRHKHFIYFIKQLKNDAFKLIASLNFQSDMIYEVTTNNGQYLVLWKKKQDIYLLYQILNKRIKQINYCFFIFHSNRRDKLLLMFFVPQSILKIQCCQIYKLTVYKMFNKRHIHIQQYNKFIFNCFHQKFFMVQFRTIQFRQFLN